MSPALHDIGVELVFLASVIGAVGALGKYLINVYVNAKKPFMEYESRYTELKEENKRRKDEIAELKRSIRKSDNALENQEKMNECMMKALSALLSHGIDGNNEEEMRESRKEIQQRLLDAGSSIR